MNLPNSHARVIGFPALAAATSVSAQSLKVTGLIQSGNQITITVRNTGSSTTFRRDGSASSPASFPPQ